jgi:hypothetical protein
MYIAVALTRRLAAKTVRIILSIFLNAFSGSQLVICDPKSVPKYPEIIIANNRGIQAI